MTTDTCTAPAHFIALNEPPMVRRMLLKRLAFMEPTSMRTGALGPIAQAYIRADAVVAACDRGMGAGPSTGDREGRTLLRTTPARPNIVNADPLVVSRAGAAATFHERVRSAIEAHRPAGAGDPLVLHLHDDVIIEWTKPSTTRLLLDEPGLGKRWHEDTPAPCGGVLAYETMAGVFRVHKAGVYRFRCPKCGHEGTNDGEARTCDQPASAAKP